MSKLMRVERCSGGELKLVETAVLNPIKGNPTKDISDEHVFGLEITIPPGSIGLREYKTSFKAFELTFKPDFHRRKSGPDYECVFQLKYNEQHYSGKARKYGCRGSRLTVVEIFSDKPMDDKSLVEKIYDVFDRL